MNEKNELEQLRDEINNIDEQIVNLLNKRFDLVYKVGEYKKKSRLPVLNIMVENEKIKKIQEIKGLNYYHEICELFQIIFRYSRDIQEEIV